MTTFTAYKYLNASSAKRCIKDGTLYLAGVDQLNDSLEARFNLAGAEDYIAIIEATLSAVARQRGESEWRFSRDAMPEFAEMHQQENARFQASCAAIGICSLAKRPDHQAMWAYYGEQGAGLCFELTFTHEIMEAYNLMVGPVDYSNAPRELNRAEDWRVEFLALAERYPEATIAQLHEMSLDKDFRHRWGLRMAQRATAIKDTDWAHEDELRLVGPKGRTPLPILSQVLTCVHYRNIEALYPVAELLVGDYSELGFMEWTFDYGKLRSHAKPKELRFVPK